MLAGLAGLSCLVATHGLRIGASLSGGPAEGRPTASGRSTSSRCAPTTNMSVTLLPEEDPLSLYQEAKAQQMSDPLLEGLLRQTFGALEDKVMLGALEDKVMLFEDKVMLLENANEALQKQLRWAEEVEMRLKVEVACVRAVVDSRSVIELGVREFYILNPKPKMKDFHSARIKSFIFDHVLNDPGNKAPKKTFTGLLKTRPEEIRSQLTTAGFKGSSASWDPSVLRDEFDHLHTKLSSMVHNSDTVSTLPFLRVVLGRPRRILPLPRSFSQSRFLRRHTPSCRDSTISL